MTVRRKTILGAAIGAAALALSAASASADVACSGDVCWHVKDKMLSGESKVHPRKLEAGPTIEFRGEGPRLSRAKNVG
jgi:hypothetical protein